MKEKTFQNDRKMTPRGLLQFPPSPPSPRPSRGEVIFLKLWSHFFVIFLKFWSHFFVIFLSFVESFFCHFGVILLSCPDPSVSFFVIWRPLCHLVCHSSGIVQSFAPILMYVVLIIVVVARVRRGTRAQQCRFWGPCGPCLRPLKAPGGLSSASLGPCFVGPLTGPHLGPQT